MQAFHETHDLIFQPVPVAHEYDLVLGEEEVLDSVEDLLTTLLNKVGGGLFLGVGFGFFFWFIVELAAGGVAGLNLTYMFYFLFFYLYILIC